MRYYLDTGPMDRLYEEGAHLFGSPDFDLDSAGAWLLGRDSRKVLEHGESPDDLVVEAKQVVHP
jgi:predicted nucleotidyltransferase